MPFTVKFEYRALRWVLPFFYAANVLALLAIVGGLYTVSMSISGGGLLLVAWRYKDEARFWRELFQDDVAGEIGRAIKSQEMQGLDVQKTGGWPFQELLTEEQEN